jgi:hypothetical protein
MGRPQQATPAPARYAATSKGSGRPSSLRRSQASTIPSISAPCQQRAAPHTQRHGQGQLSPSARGRGARRRSGIVAIAADGDAGGEVVYGLGEDRGVGVVGGQHPQLFGDLAGGQRGEGGQG